MAQGYEALTEKEKQALRLILRGHDAKSSARRLDISVHTVNERLRHARRKMDVSSSRGAARMLLAKEGETPDLFVSKEIGDDLAAATPDHEAVPNVGQRKPIRPAFLIGGIAIMSLLATGIALILSIQATQPPSAADIHEVEAAASAEFLRMETEEAARDWLVLVDAQRWEESWNAAAQSFRDPNTLERWTTVSKEVRLPLGAVLARETTGALDIPAPPAGYRTLLFTTDFANRAGATETVTLVREGGSWRVVGYYIS